MGTVGKDFIGYKAAMEEWIRLVFALAITLEYSLLEAQF